jgi:hypothetical protein
MPSNNQNQTIALVAYAAAVALTALLFVWREARLYDVAVASSADAEGAATAALDGRHRPPPKSNAFDPHATHALWTQFQPLLPPLLALWLWCRAVARYARRGVPFALCFPREDRSALPSASALAATAARVSAIAATSFALSVVLLAASGGKGLLDAVALYAVPIAMYAILLLWLLWPASASSSSAFSPPSPPPLTPRLLLRRTLARAFLPGLLAPVGWADFYLADCLTSLSKSFLDAERALCASLGAGPLRLRPQHLAASKGACGASSPPALLALCLPFFLRLCQCLSVAFFAGGGSGSGSGGDEGGGGDNEQDGSSGDKDNAQQRQKRQQQLANALKYAAAMAAATLTQLEHEHHVHGQPFPLRHVWIAASVGSALFSFAWDAEMDWGLEWWLGWLANERQRWGRAWRRRQQSSSPSLGWAVGPWSSPPPLVPRLPAAAAPATKSSGGESPQQLNFPLLLAANALLRMSWAHRLVGDLEAHAIVQMSVALLEVLRRHRWGHARHALELSRRRRRRRRRPGGAEAAAGGEEGESGGSGSSSSESVVSDGDPEAGAAAALLVPATEGGHHHRQRHG